MMLLWCCIAVGLIFGITGSGSVVHVSLCSAGCLACGWRGLFGCVVGWWLCFGGFTSTLCFADVLRFCGFCCITAYCSLLIAWWFRVVLMVADCDWLCSC